MVGRGRGRERRLRGSRWRAALTNGEWRRLGVLGAAVLGLHLAGFLLLFVVVVPAHLRVGDAGLFTAGIGLTAYMLGVRHAFDADHIAAIDSTTRKLMGDGQRPLSVGFFFSLGHSSVVFLLAFLLSVGVKALVGPVQDGDSALHEITGFIGPSVSGTFLYIIGAINLAILAGIFRGVGAMRRGERCSEDLVAGLGGGPMSRLLVRVTGAVRRPWHMYPLGFLFGLGFDTATEVSLLFLASGAAGAGLPWYAILCLPILFAAGMSLFDTIDGSFMNFAYGWAVATPARRLYYNATVTAVSALVALGIGTIELLSVIADRFGLRGGVWGAAGSVDLNVVGYGVVGLFALTWALAALVWRLARIEERWSGPADARLELLPPQLASGAGGRSATTG